MKIFLFIPLFLFICFIMVKYVNLEFVFAQYAPAIENVTAGVRVGGALGDIIVDCYPINFTVSATQGVNPGTPAESNPKRNACGRPDIMVDLSVENNVLWEIWLNASNMVETVKNSNIPPGRIYVNGTTTVGGNCLTSLTSLSTTLQRICWDIPYNGYANISFWLSPLVGQYNSTYYGNITIWVNSTEAQIEPLNKTWFGKDNTTVKIERFIAIFWNGTPIDFATLAPGSTSNATPSHGWPANITSDLNTNIYIELYLNGTDFKNSTSVTPWNENFCSDSTCLFESQNTSFSNATSVATWPSGILPLNSSFQISPNFRGSFPNWGCNSTLCSEANPVNLTFPNATVAEGIKNIWWNISIPAGMPAGNYSATVWAKAADIGEVA